MATATKTEHAAQVERLRKSLGRVKAKHAALGKLLAEALERQTATAEILKVISSSPTDVQPVFEAIARNALALCGSSFANVFRYDGKLMHYAASHHVAPEQVEIVKRGLPAPPSRSRVAGRAILSKSVVCIEDALTDPEYDRHIAVGAHWRRMFAAPMLRDGAPLGAVAVGWPEPGPIPKAQEELLKTFADQAVIAIGNVRLFKELEARNRDLTEALEQQTATAEILRVIASSPTDLQPVMTAIAEHAARVCGAADAVVYEAEGDALREAANYGSIPTLAAQRLRLNRQSVSGRAFVDRQTVHVQDLASEVDTEYPDVKEIQKQIGHRTTLATPLLRNNLPIGVILIRRLEVRPFSDKQIGLLKTFADQAVIAIENVRLFNETKEALERQTATAEILEVISSSPTDVQPVFDIIGAQAERLCAANVSVVSRFDGERIQLVTLHGVAKEGVEAVRRAYPMRPDDETVAARAFRSRAVIHIADVLADPDYQQKDAARAGAYRGCLGVPMVRGGR